MSMPSSPKKVTQLHYHQIPLLLGTHYRVLSILHQLIDLGLLIDSPSTPLHSITSLASLSTFPPSSSHLLLLNDNFKRTFWEVLASPTPIFDPSSTPQNDAEFQSNKDQAESNWNSILLYLLNYTTTLDGKQQHNPSKISSITKKLLKHKGLILKTPRGILLTKEGWKFLFLDTATQLWTLLIAYNSIQEVNETEQVELVSLLLKMNFQTVERGYRLSSLSPIQITLLRDFAVLGLTYIMEEQDLYYTTKLSSKLLHTPEITPTLNNSNPNPNTTTDEGHIILENNYRIYTYSRSPIHLFMTHLFSQVTSLYPNLIISIITRETTLHLSSKGVPASLLVNYLQRNYHRRMKDVTAAVLKVVVEQILIWGNEGKRVGFEKGVLYDGFQDQKGYEEVKRFSQELGVYVWGNDDKLMVFVKESGHDCVRDFIKENIV